MEIGSVCCDWAMVRRRRPTQPRPLPAIPPPVHASQVDKLRKENVNLKKSNESLRRERQYDKQKALNTYEASGMSYHALNQTVKALSLSKQKLTAEVRWWFYFQVPIKSFGLS